MVDLERTHESGVVQDHEENGEMGAIRKEFLTLKEEAGNLKREVGRYGRSLGSLEKRLNDMNSRLGQVEKEVRTLNQDVGIIEENMVELYDNPRLWEPEKNEGELSSGFEIDRKGTTSGQRQEAETMGGSSDMGEEGGQPSDKGSEEEGEISVTPGKGKGDETHVIGKRKLQAEGDSSEGEEGPKETTKGTDKRMKLRPKKNLPKKGKK